MPCHVTAVSKVMIVRQPQLTPDRRKAGGTPQHMYFTNHMLPSSELGSQRPDRERFLTKSSCSTHARRNRESNKVAVSDPEQKTKRSNGLNVERALDTK